jgi:predicted GNAT superfamily acetyltransferase
MTDLRVLTKPEDLAQVEALQRVIWPGNETEIMTVHMLRAVADHGGVVIGAFDEDGLVGHILNKVPAEVQSPLDMDHP